MRQLAIYGKKANRAAYGIYNQLFHSFVLWKLLRIVPGPATEASQVGGCRWQKHIEPLTLPRGYVTTIHMVARLNISVHSYMYRLGLRQSQELLTICASHVALDSSRLIIEEGRREFQG